MQAGVVLVKFEIKIDAAGNVHLEQAGTSNEVTVEGTSDNLTITVDPHGGGVEFSFLIKDVSPNEKEWVFADLAGEFSHGSCQDPVFSVFVGPVFAGPAGASELKIGFKNNASEDVPFSFKLFFLNIITGETMVYDPTVILKPPPPTPTP